MFVLTVLKVAWAAMSDCSRHLFFHSTRSKYGLKRMHGSTLNDEDVIILSGEKNAKNKDKPISSKTF